MKKILVIGAGGIGSYLIPILSRAGIYKIQVNDDDIVESKNLLYQNFKEEDIGENKALIMENQYTNVDSRPYKVLTEKQLKGFDLVICCADNLDVRRLLYRSETEWLDLRSQGRNAVLISSEIDKQKMDTVLVGPEGSFSCQGDSWTGKAKDVHYTHIAVAGMGAQWTQRKMNQEEVKDFIIINI